MHLLWLCSTRGIPISYFMHHCSVWIFCMPLCYRKHINSIDIWHFCFFLFAWSQRSHVVYGCQNCMFNWIKCVVLLPWWAWNPAQPDRAPDWLACRHWYIMQQADSPNGNRAALELLLWAVRQESLSFLMICVFCDAPSLYVHQILVCTHPEDCLLCSFDRMGMGMGQMGYVGAMLRKSRRQDPLLLSPAASLPQ